jgi:hypothetical protein
VRSTLSPWSVLVSEEIEFVECEALRWAMAFVPGGQHDRSHWTRYRLLMAGLARSAWESASQKSRPVGYGLIRAGSGTDSMIEATKFRIPQYGRTHLRREIPQGDLG